MRKNVISSFSGTIGLILSVALIALPMQACSKSDESDHGTSGGTTDGNVAIKLEKKDAAILVIDENNEITRVFSVHDGVKSPVVQCQFCTPELTEKYPTIGNDCEKIWTSTLIRNMKKKYDKKYSGKKNQTDFEAYLRNPEKLTKKMRKMTPDNILPVCFATTKGKNQSGQAAFIKQTFFGSHKCAIYAKVGGTVLWEDPAGCGWKEH